MPAILSSVCVYVLFAHVRVVVVVVGSRVVVRGVIVVGCRYCCWLWW